MDTDKEKQALIALFRRYKGRVQFMHDHANSSQNKCDAASLYNLCLEAEENYDDYPADKMHRWLGFVQGVMAAQGVINVDDERDHTRPIFHELYGKTSKTFDSSN